MQEKDRGLRKMHRGARQKSAAIVLIESGCHVCSARLHGNAGNTGSGAEAAVARVKSSFPYFGNKTDVLHRTQTIKGNVSIQLRWHVLRCSEQPRLQPLTDPSEDSQAWKTYSYLDEGAARGTERDNRGRRIPRAVALHWEWLQHHPLYRRQSNLAVMCKDTYLPGEDFSTAIL